MHFLLRWWYKTDEVGKNFNIKQWWENTGNLLRHYLAFLQTRGAQAAHMATVCCYFKMPLLPGIDRFHNPLKRLCRLDYCKHVHVSVWLLVTRCDAMYLSAKSTLHTIEDLFWLVVKFNIWIVWASCVCDSLLHSYFARCLYGSVRLVEKP